MASHDLSKPLASLMNMPFKRYQQVDRGSLHPCCYTMTTDLPALEDTMADPAIELIDMHAKEP